MGGLSQEEIDSLLNTLGGKDADPQARRLKKSSKRLSLSGYQGYRLYDFKRPDKLSKDVLRVLRTSFTRFTRGVTNYLTSLTRTSVDISLTEVVQTTYGEIFRCTEPTLMCTFSIVGGSHGMLRISLRQLYAVLDRLMGGPGSGSLIDRPLTDFERSLMTEICATLLSSYQECIDIETEVKVDMVDTDERVLPRTMANDETMVRANYELRLGGTKGELSLNTPLSALSHIFGNVSRSDGEGNDKAVMRNLPPNLASLPLPVTVELGRAQLSANQVGRLQVGDIVHLGQEEAGPLRVTVGGVPRFAGRPGLISKRLVVVIEGAWSGKK